MSKQNEKKWDPTLLPRIIRMYMQGYTEEQVAKAIGVARMTLYRWRQEHPELANVKEAKDYADDNVEASLYLRAIGYSFETEKVFMTKNGQIVRAPTVTHLPPDVGAIQFYLKNRRPEKWKSVEHQVNSGPVQTQLKATFEQFCERASYPAPFPKQIEMMEFGIHSEETRLLLGARGYGKTDFVTILGTAYDIYQEYLDFSSGNKSQLESTTLIISKSQTRNASMMQAIGDALKLNGVPLEKENTSVIRVSGLVGKDHSVEAITIKSSLRGRHPKRIICDDVVTEEDTSDAMRLLVSKKYSEAYKLTSNICIIGQPAHAFDLYADLRPIIKKMEVAHGSIPELDADLEAMKLAGVDERSIQMSYHLTVPATSDNAFSKVNYIDSFPVKQSVAFIDPSFEGGDYTAMSIVTSHFDGIAVQGKVWKKAWYDVIDEIAKAVDDFQVSRLCFETNSLGEQPIGLLRQKLSCGVVGKKSIGNKHARIMGAGGFGHLIHLSKTSDKVYIDQVVKYEYKATNDDAPDSLASCMEWLGLIKGQK